MKIKFTEERRGEIRRIQDAFRNHLSEKDILKATATGINSAMSRTIGHIKKAIAAEYNITSKHLGRVGKVSLYAKPDASQLYAHISLNTKPFPTYAFKPTVSGSNVSVTYSRGGGVSIIQNAFIATVPAGSKSEHTGVFFRGMYMKPRGMDRGKYYTDTRQTGQRGRILKKVRITEAHGPSVYGMGRSKEVAAQAQEYMSQQALARVEGVLRNRVEKIARQ